MFKKIKAIFETRSNVLSNTFIVEKLENGYLLNQKKYLKTKEEIKKEINNFIDKKI